MPSRACGRCGCADKRNSPVRTRFACTACGFERNAGHNAALNILAAGRAATACGAGTTDAPGIFAEENRRPARESARDHTAKGMPDPRAREQGNAAPMPKLRISVGHANRFSPVSWWGHKQFSVVEVAGDMLAVLSGVVFIRGIRATAKRRVRIRARPEASARAVPLRHLCQKTARIHDGPVEGVAPGRAGRVRP
ncbi:zinc ribbon domain-containing protein [uncultured Desulfovibrio sp.]|uniref:zinc ribbon domain-containing protein n=1 Tax=uncultured Desulfovibrio sp. TaxID=167968 RepID=UPI00345C2F93